MSIKLVPQSKIVNYLNAMKSRRTQKKKPDGDDCTNFYFAQNFFLESVRHYLPGIQYIAFTHIRIQPKKKESD